MTNKEKIDKLSLDIFKGATSAFNDLEQMRMILINIEIAVAGLSDSEDARALSEIAKILERAILQIEEKTKKGRDCAKEIGLLIKEV